MTLGKRKVYREDQRVIDVVDTCYPVGFQLVDRLSVQYACASVARSNRLLSSMLASYRANEHEGGWGLLRVLQESMFATLYLLYGEMPAVERLARSDWVRITEHAKISGSPEPRWPPTSSLWADFSKERPEPKEKMSAYDLRQALLGVLEELGPDRDHLRRFIEESYRSVYRMMSQGAIHPSLSMIGFHRVIDAVTDESVVLARIPKEPTSHLLPLGMGATFVSSSAYETFLGTPDLLPRLQDMVEKWAAAQQRMMAK